jgi:dipeptidyl aminopeptidase/acylaminoacyl peptidase
MVWMTLVKLILALAFLSVVFTGLLLILNSHPPRYAVGDSPLSYGIRFEDISFLSLGGVRLAGWFLHGGTGGQGEERCRPAILICHGLGASKADFAGLASHLIGAGFHVLLFDFRAHGNSDGFRTSFGHLEQADLQGALRFLKAKAEVDPERIGVYGFSMGASVAILTAAKDTSIRAVVSDSAFTSLEDQINRVVTALYHLPRIPFYYLSHWIYDLYFWTCLEKVSPINAIAKLSPRPVLLIAGQNDDRMTTKDVQNLFEAASQPKELWVISDAGHGATLAMAGQTYPERVVSFFKRVL